MKDARFLPIALLVTCCILLSLSPGVAPRASAQGGLLLNGDFEGSFYPFGSGYVAQSWVPYDLNLDTSPPQYLRSTLHKHDGQASQQIWSDNAPWYAGILQTTLLTSSPTGARIQAGKRYIVHVWTYSIYGGASSAVQDGKLNKRVGIHPAGAANPKATGIVWTPWHGQDKAWVLINAAVEATGNRLTVFVEAEDKVSGGQDQLYIDGVWLEEEGAATPTPTRTSTPVATPTATPGIGVVRSIGVGDRPQGVAAMPSMNRFFVADSGANKVSRLDGFFGWRRAEFPSGGQGPTNIAIDPEACRAYVVNTASNSLAVFNICADRQVGTVNLGSGLSPEGVAVLTTTHTIYVANAADDSVSAIDSESLQVVKRIPTGPRPAQVAANPHTGKVYVTYRGYTPGTVGGVTVIDAATNAVKTTIGLSSGDAVPAPDPHGVAVHPLANRVYVASASGKLVVIDGGRDTVIRAIASPSSAGLQALALNPSSNNVFVGSLSGNQVFVFDVDEGRWGPTLAVGSGSPRGIAVNPLTYDVVVTNPDEDTVHLLRDFGLYQPFRLWLPILRR